MISKATCMQHFWKVPREGLLPHWQDKTNTLRHNGQDSIWNLHYCRAGLLLRQRVRLLKLGQAMCMQPFGEEQDTIYWKSHNIFTVYYDISYTKYSARWQSCNMYRILMYYTEIHNWCVCLLHCEYDGCSIIRQVWSFVGSESRSRCIPPAIISTTHIMYKLNQQRYSA